MMDWDIICKDCPKAIHALLTEVLGFDDIELYYQRQVSHSYNLSVGNHTLRLDKEDGGVKMYFEKLGTDNYLLRGLYDLFDNHGILIRVEGWYDENEKKIFKGIFHTIETEYYPTRREAEEAIFEKAFEELEGMLMAKQTGEAELKRIPNQKY